MAEEMCSLLKTPSLEDVFHPVTPLFSQDLLDPELAHRLYLVIVHEAGM